MCCLLYSEVFPAIFEIIWSCLVLSIISLCCRSRRHVVPKLSFLLLLPVPVTFNIIGVMPIHGITFLGWNYRIVCMKTMI